MNWQSSPRAGISLIELLVALALLALIATGLSGAMGLGVRIWERSSGLETFEDELILRAHLRNWISLAAYPGRLAPTASDFVGRSSALGFVSVAPIYHKPDAMAVQVQLTAGTGGLSIDLNYIGFDGQVLGSDTRRLTDQQVEISYFDGRTGTWVTAWDDQSILPSLVRIRPLEETTGWPLFVGTTSPS